MVYGACDLGCLLSLPPPADPAKAQRKDPGGRACDPGAEAHLGELPRAVSYVHAISCCSVVPVAVAVAVTVRSEVGDLSACVAFAIERIAQ